jgi:hypothetical protein
MEKITIPSNLQSHILIARRIENLRKNVGFIICKKVGVVNDKVRRYFERAFVRWVFNSISKGRNPFLVAVKYQDFIYSEDIDYVAKRENIETELSSMDWSWLSQKFTEIHTFGSNYLIGLKVYPQGRDMVFRFEIRTEGVSTVDRMECFISSEQYQKARSLCFDKKNVDVLLSLVLARYEACGTTNNHSSVPKEVISFTDAKIELFGSPVNTLNDQYCSPFRDLETVFGSLGSFFDFKFTSGTYFMNPPFDELLMKNAALKVIDALRSRVPITVIVVIPAWDIQSQYEYHGKIYTDKEYDTLTILEASGFVRSKKSMDYRTCKFFNYYTNEHVNLASCHLIVLSNTLYKITANDIALVWERIK